MRFVDTNVLLYAVSALPEDASKRRRSQALLKSSDLSLSVQVLQEFYYRAVRRGGMAHEDALSFLKPLLRLPVQDVTLDVFRRAVAISQRFQLSYWDGAILAAASALGCDTIYTEDLNTGQDYGGVRAVNPFIDPIRAI